MSDANKLVGERARLACSFRRPAENLVTQTRMALTMVRARRPNRHAGRVRSQNGGAK